MKPKLGVYLTDDVAKLLKAAVRPSPTSSTKLSGGFSVPRPRRIPAERCFVDWMAWPTGFDASIGMGRLWRRPSRSTSASSS